MHQKTSEFFDSYYRRYFDGHTGVKGQKDLFLRHFHGKKLGDELFSALYDREKIVLPGMIFYKTGSYPREFFRLLRENAEMLGSDLLEFCLCAYIVILEKTKELYKAFGLDESIFWDTAKALAKKAKTLPDGRLVLPDYVFCARYLCLGLIRLGSFDFQLCCFPFGESPRFSSDDIVIKIHVPDGCDLSKEKRILSYGAAYDLFSCVLTSKRTIFACESWLLADHSDILPESSNIVSFRRDFEIIEEYRDIENEIPRRIFGDADISFPEELPEHTSLMRGYKKRLISGAPFYSCAGVFEVVTKEDIWKK